MSYTHGASSVGSEDWAISPWPKWGSKKNRLGVCSSGTYPRGSAHATTVNCSVGLVAVECYEQAS